MTIPAVPFFSNIGASSGRNLEYASTILFCISFILVVAVYVIYWKGPTMRKRSPFAQRLADARQEQENTGRRVSVSFDPERERRGSHVSQSRPAMQDRRFSQQNRFFGESRVTPRGTPRGTPSASRRPSAANLHK